MQYYQSFSFLELINAILQIILSLASSFTSFNTRWKVQIWTHKSYSESFTCRYYQCYTTFICKKWLKRQNKISEKVLYLKILLIEKESTSSPGRFLKAEHAVLQRLFTENRTRSTLLFNKYTVSTTSHMG